MSRSPSSHEEDGSGIGRIETKFQNEDGYFAMDIETDRDNNDEKGSTTSKTSDISSFQNVSMEHQETQNLLPKSDGPAADPEVGGDEMDVDNMTDPQSGDDEMDLDKDTTTFKTSDISSSRNEVMKHQGNHESLANNDGLTRDSASGDGKMDGNKTAEASPKAMTPSTGGAGTERSPSPFNLASSMPATQHHSLFPRGAPRSRNPSPSPTRGYTMKRLRSPSNFPEPFPPPPPGFEMDYFPSPLEFPARSTDQRQFPSSFGFNARTPSRPRRQIAPVSPSHIDSDAALARKLQAEEDAIAERRHGGSSFGLGRPQTPIRRLAPAPSYRIESDAAIAARMQAEEEANAGIRSRRSSESMRSSYELARNPTPLRRQISSVSSNTIESDAELAARLQKEEDANDPNAMVAATTLTSFRKSVSFEPSTPSPRRPRPPREQPQVSPPGGASLKRSSPTPYPSAPSLPPIGTFHPPQRRRNPFKVPPKSRKSPASKMNPKKSIGHISTIAKSIGAKVENEISDQNGTQESSEKLAETLETVEKGTKIVEEKEREKDKKVNDVVRTNVKLKDFEDVPNSDDPRSEPKTKEVDAGLDRDVTMLEPEVGVANSGDGGAGKYCI